MTAVRPRLDIEDSFFEPGNELSLSDCCFAYVEYKIDDNGNSSQSNHNHESQEPRYECNVKGCNFVGYSIQECEDHYNSKHMYECKECHKNMPTPYLLDAHIQETHDSYFQSMLDRNEAVYKCLVECCSEKFSSDKDRRRHLIENHGYPSWFRFHSKSHPHEKKTKKTIDVALNRKLSLQKESISPKETSHDPKVDAEVERKMKRSARRKLRNESIPCRFFNTKRGCRRGDKCMFLHKDYPIDEDGPIDTNIDTNEEHKIFTTSVDEDTTMEDLTNDLSSLQVFIPSQISFGRRRK
jgi:hypothetical protein